MKRLTLILLALTGITVLGCSYIGKGVRGSGVRKTEKRDLKPFNRIETTGAYELDVSCQKPASFEIVGDDNILPLIKTEVRDGVLYVTNDQKYNSSRLVLLRITLSKLDSISTSGAGHVQVANVKTDTFEIHNSGAVSIDATGEGKTVKIASNGAGKIDTSNLRAQKAEVTVAGAASIDVYASDQLDVNVSGVGQVSYSGDPKVVNKNVSGVGSVTKKD